MSLSASTLPKTLAFYDSKTGEDFFGPPSKEEWIFHELFGHAYGYTEEGRIYEQWDAITRTNEYYRKANGLTYLRHPCN